MRLTFIHLAVFRNDWKWLKLEDEDLRTLEMLVLEDPLAGRLIPGAGGLRKIRFSPPHWRRGKSGAIRVCYAYFARHSTVAFLAAYAKNEQENIGAKDKTIYRQLLVAIEGELSGRG